MASRQNLQLFQFSVPGLPETQLALWAIQVLDILELPTIVPVPLGASGLQGICRWQNEIVTVLDLGVYLNGGSEDSSPQTPWRAIIAQCVFDGQIIHVCIPILMGAKIVNIQEGNHVPQAETNIESALIQDTLLLNENTVNLLNLNVLHSA